MLWHYLTYEIGKWKREVVIMGNFNEVRYKSDKFGSVFNVQCANVFNSFIMNVGLEEVPLGGSSFTWCHKSATKMSKLDRFLISKNLLNTCSNITAITLERYLSDHQPILLHGSHFDYGPTSFRFFHHWIEMECFSKVVKDAWSSKNVKAKYKDELEALEAIIEKGDGDEHTSFVRGMLNKKQSLLIIRGIMVDGMWIESPNRMKGEFFHHFSSLFDKPDARRAHIEMWYPKTLICDQQVELESNVSNEEIKRAVWDCGIDKSPGPDGFTFGFYRRFWNLIENDVYDAVKYFFTYEVIPKGCNSSFIALILKMADVNTVKDFRPISLIGSLYKIVAKILAKCLVGVLEDIVNEVQSAFIAGSQILDGPFILNEVLQWCKIKTKQSLIFKVDFEKEYDSVRWDFLNDMKKNLDLVKNSVSGFKATLDLRQGQDLNSKKASWVNWKKVLAPKEKGSLDVSSLYALNKGMRGLRKGDPLSPYLFTLIMEVLNLVLIREIKKNPSFRYHWLCKEVKLTHLCFAYDLLLFCNGDSKSVSVMKNALAEFSGMSGLLPNCSKSTVFFENVRDGCRRKILGIMPFKEGTLPVRYLGVPLISKRLYVKDFHVLIDKARKRILDWKNKSLSFAGRLQLIKSVISSMQVYWASMFILPVSISNDIEKLMRDFLWNFG
nr:RNA-directed DNA polymerase, eukaryota [Tanacetum cinerariifolium]